MTTAPRRRARGGSCSVVAVERLLCGAWPDWNHGPFQVFHPRLRLSARFPKKSSFRRSSVVNKTVVLWALESTGWRRHARHHELQAPKLGEGLAC